VTTENLPLRATDLKQKFGVFGHFYDLRIGDECIPCRSVLELIAHDQTPLYLGHLAESTPQLITVMMNPGSSKPLDPDYIPDEIDRIEDVRRKREWVPARPDNTQYQIMRVLAANGLHHARILNLSDIRNPKSGQFMDTVHRLNGLPDGALHSIFCSERTTELTALVGGPDIPVLAGWGRNRRLRPLAEKALARLSGRKLLGLPVEDGTLFAHPSPMLQRMKDIWLSEINRQFSTIR